MSRAARILLIVLAALAFFVLSGLLARVLSANTAERAAIVRLLRAQARGDGARVQVLAYDPSTRFSLGGTRGVARVAWRVPPRPPVVQCVTVHRGGDPFSGLRVALSQLSAPIPGDASCPKR